MRKYRRPTFEAQIGGWWDENHEWHDGTPPAKEYQNMTGFVFYLQGPNKEWREWHTVYWPPDSPLVGYTLQQMRDIFEYYNEFGSPDAGGNAIGVIET